MEYTQAIPALKALSDETRLKIIDMLSCGEMCACKILEKFDITQPTLSYHMKILTECGLVKGVRQGAWMWYSLDADQFVSLTGFLSQLSSEKENCICREE